LDQIPSWLDANHPRIKIVTHNQILDPEILPTFNSYTIESRLHHIPGLANTYLYFNNDMFLNQRVSKANWMPSENEYIRFRDWPLAFTPYCSLAFRSNKFAPTCWKQYLFHDAYLSSTVFGVRLTHWYMHVPRMYKKNIMMEVERHIEPWLTQSRKNRLRNLSSDVMIHLQYESFLRTMHKEIRITDVTQPKYDVYVFVMRGNRDSASSYVSLQDKIDRFRPRFVTIDDDLKQPSKELLDFHIGGLCRLMKRQWSNRAPWELSHTICETS